MPKINEPVNVRYEFWTKKSQSRVSNLNYHLIRPSTKCYYSGPLNNSLNGMSPLIQIFFQQQTPWYIQSMVGWIHFCGTLDKEGLHTQKDLRYGGPTINYTWIFNWTESPSCNPCIILGSTTYEPRWLKYLLPLLHVTLTYEYFYLHVIA